MAYPVFDLHCDTADRLAWQTLPADLRAAGGRDFYGPGDEADPGACRELARNRCHLSLEAVGATPWAQCLACYVPDELSPEQAARFCDHVFAHAEAQAEKNADAVTLARSAADVRPALASGRFVAVRTIENARMFAADLGLVTALAGRGVLMASLTWNAAGPLASGHDSHAGLSPIGASALAEMERAGMALDVSHLNDEGFADVCRLARRPFAASHSNARAVCGHPRNLTDDQFREIRDCGGVVGLNYCCRFLADDGAPETVTFDDVAAHVEHWLDLGGEDVVALGSDFDGCDVPAFLNGAQTMPSFQALLDFRFGETVARKLCAENALAFFERVAAA
ncbi:membrane dipeptidase [Thermophilibacter sp. ET337]|uniref:dipeptidase n=1 Tax=Thermophilibacter sp. ET337 TaxID=2973084 RepID=UPI0021AD4037|nr:membrane dipeptidase [Thermophilibacter sp. ET337]MCR8907373.1 membrane dipeptidase [Thermophilibacter sp. ET337]